MLPSSINPTDEIKQMMREGFKEMTDKIDRLDQRLRAIETNENGCRAIQEIKVKALETDIKALELLHEKDRSALEAGQQALLVRLDAVEPWVKAVKWIAGALGLSIITLLWGIFTHTITLTIH